jgi:pimeloyl-ACP methyl ester carboxylesterase
MPRTVIVILCCAAAAATLYAATRAYAAKLLKKFLRAPKPGSLGLDYGEEFEAMCARGDRWSRENPERMVYLNSRDGYKLAAHWWDFGRERTVIFVHGYGNTGIQATLVAPLLIDLLDANILAPDCRGHGESGCEYIGMGWPDRFDVVDWANYITDLKGEQHDIVLFGLSMGGSAVVSASGETLPRNVRVICSDCGFSSLSEMFSDVLKRRMHLPKWPLLAIADSEYKKMFGYSFYDVEPIKQISKASTPVLIIHGSDDQFVPVGMASELYRACPADKELFIVKGARHALSSVVDTEGYCAAVSAFCKRYLA